MTKKGKGCKAGDLCLSIRALLLPGTSVKATFSGMNQVVWKMVRRERDARLEIFVHL